MKFATAPKAAPTSSTTSTPRKVISERTADIILGLFPDINSGARATHKFFATFLSIVLLSGFLVLLGVNTLLAQDAFTLANLKAESKLVAYQREAINRRLDLMQAPEKLAEAAVALGMRPSQNPVFLDLTPKEVIENG